MTCCKVKISRSTTGVTIIILLLTFCLSNMAYSRSEDVNNRLEKSYKAMKDRHAQALREIKDARASEDVNNLIEKLKDDNHFGRERAVEALGKIKDARAVEPLIVALRDEDFSVRDEAAEVLGEIKDARAVEPLIAALKDRDLDVRERAAKALGEIKDARAVEPLIIALQEEEVQSYAQDALVNIGPPAVESLVVTLKDNDEDIQRCAQLALIRIGPPAVESLIAALEDRDSDVRKGAAEALGKIKDARAVEPLIAALKKDRDSGVRERAAEALKEIDDLHAIATVWTVKLSLKLAYNSPKFEENLSQYRELYVAINNSVKEAFEAYGFQIVEPNAKEVDLIASVVVRATALAARYGSGFPTPTTKTVKKGSNDYIIYGETWPKGTKFYSLHTGAGIKGTVGLRTAHAGRTFKFAGEISPPLTLTVLTQESRGKAKPVVSTPFLGAFRESKFDQLLLTELQQILPGFETIDTIQRGYPPGYPPTNPFGFGETERRSPRF